MPPSARPPGMPARVHLYVAAVAALALLLLPVSTRVAGSSRGITAALAALTLAAFIAWAHRHPVHVGPKRKMNVATAPEVAAALLLAGPLVMLTLAAGTLAGEARLPARPVQRVFNVAAAALRGLAGAGAYAAVIHLRPAAVAQPAAALAAAAALYAISLVLVRGVVATQLRQNPLRRASLPQRDTLLTEAALGATGIMAALASADHAWALLLLMGPAAIAQRAVRHATALQAQTQVAQASLTEATAALATRDEFLSIASHELRTPLTSLKSYLELARRRLGPAGVAQEVTQLMIWADAQIDRLEGLISGLLDVSRMAAGRFVIEQEPVAVAPLLQHAIELQRAAEPGRLINLSLPEARPLVMADPGRLEQVLVNLLENARKYSPPDKPIHVSLDVTESTVAIAVRDEGVGIPATEQERIFERFQRGSNRDPGVSGLGLGLYIACELTRAHGGELTVESTPGAGSTFTLILPRPDIEHDEIALEQSQL